MIPTDLLLRRESGVVAPQAHRVEFFDYPVDSIVAPEGFARDYGRRYSKDSITICLRASAFDIFRSFASRIVDEISYVQRAFAQNLGDRRRVFYIKFALEETLKHSRRILAKPSMLLSIDSAHHRQPRVEQFLRSADYDSAFVGEPARVRIQVPNFIPVVRLTLFQIAAVGDARFEVARNEVQLHPMRSFQPERRLQREVRERAF